MSREGDEMQISVGELIAKLKEYPPHMLVVRGDIDYANVKVTQVAFVLVEDQGERYCPEVFWPDTVPEEGEVRSWMVKIS
jgi:hypothetical protein